METVRIDDVHFDQAEVSVTMGTVRGHVVNLDLILTATEIARH